MTCMVSMPHRIQVRTDEMRIGPREVRTSESAGVEGVEVAIVTDGGRVSRGEKGPLAVKAVDQRGEGRGREMDVAAKVLCIEYLRREARETNLC